jgi:zinc protease
MRRLAVVLALALAAGAVSPAVAAPAQKVATSVDQLTYPPLPELEVSKPRREVLANGMVVMLVEDHELPLVGATALIRTGSRWEPAELAGLAGLTGEVLRTGGTGSMSGDELDDWLEGKAASIETGIGTDLGQASMSCLAEDFPAVLKVFAEVLRRPAFAADKLEVARVGELTSIARQNDDPQRILFRELDELVYGEASPFARTPTYATVGAVGRDDLVGWHRRWFHPERVVLGLVGDFDPDRALALIGEAFGYWPRGPAAEVPEAGWRETPLPGVFFVEKNDMTQAAIALGHLGIRKDHPGYYAVEVLNNLIGGSFTSRLVAEVRTAKGLAYAVAGGVGSDFDHPGVTSMWMTTKTETAGEGVAALLAEARGLTERPPTAEEVERARTALLSSFVFNFDSPGKILRQQLTYEFFGYPLDRMERFRRGIEATTVEEVRQAAAELVHAERFSILVVGPAAVRPQLAAFGEVTELDVSIPEPPSDQDDAGQEDTGQDDAGGEAGAGGGR